MKVLTVTLFCLESPDTEPCRPGDILELSTDLAFELIKDGLVIDFAGYEEKAAIIQYDGGLDREEADRQSWCRTVCMLFSPSQWKECERFKPKPCPKLIDHEK